MAYTKYNTDKTTYKHLNYSERVRIEVLLNEGYNKVEIARKLGRPKTTIESGL